MCISGTQFAFSIWESHWNWIFVRVVKLLLQCLVAYFVLSRLPYTKIILLETHCTANFCIDLHHLSLVLWLKTYFTSVIIVADWMKVEYTHVLIATCISNPFPKLTNLPLFKSIIVLIHSMLQFFISSTLLTYRPNNCHSIFFFGVRASALRGFSIPYNVTFRLRQGLRLLGFIV